MKKSKLFITFIPAVLPLAATLPIVVSCSDDKLNGPIFDISDDGVLTGFNHNWSKEDIAKKLAGKDTIVIPSNVVKISEAAFFELNSSYDIRSYTTIPSFIKTLDLSQATKLETIEDGAFVSAPFETIIFAKDIHYIQSYAFAYNLNLSCLDVSQCDTFPIDSWDVDAFDMYHSPTGVIKVKNMVSKVAWCDYFSLNKNFTFSSDKWVADIQAIDKVFKFKDQEVAGFTDSFMAEGWIVQKQLLYDVSGDYQTMYIPLYHNGIIKGVADSAFYDKDAAGGAGKSTIPGDAMEEKVKYLCFEDGVSTLSIGKEAFKKAPFYSIILSENVKTIKKDAFNLLPLLQCIDASSFSTLPTGWDTSPTTWKVEHTFEGKIILKTNSDIHNAIAQYFKTGGIPSESWSSEYKYDDPYEITYGLLRGFHPDLSEQDIVDLIEDERGNLVMTIDKNVVAVDNNAFYLNGKSTIPEIEGVGYAIVKFEDNSKCDFIGKSAFAYASNLKEITLPSQLQMIDTSAFYDNAVLDTITLPDTLEIIGDYAFNSCKLLTSINIPNSLTTLSKYAFYGCEKLATIDMTSFDSFESIPTNWSTSSVFVGLPTTGEIKVNATLFAKTPDKQVLQSYFITASGESIKFDSEHWKIVQA